MKRPLSYLVKRWRQHDRLLSDRRGTCPARDPEYLLRTQLERVLARIRETLTAKGISKRYLATQLGTSDNQIQRLLDPSILNKNLEQLYRISLLLGLELEWRVRAAA
jgi:ribosome-binding protein aMBF1 (putative translation factor)